jgi:hypothetical protein
MSADQPKNEIIEMIVALLRSRLQHCDMWPDNP